MSPSLSHWFDLVLQGAFPSCEPCERCATQVAVLVSAAVPCLDGKAIAGLHEFIDLAAASPAAARDFLEKAQVDDVR
jgi:hypothetical protein